jgi:hypothetical protein
MNGFGTSGNPANHSSSGQQAGWRWCTLCSALYWPGTDDPVCAGNTTYVLTVPIKSGPHVPGGTNYAVPFGITNNSGYQNGYNWCATCGILYWSVNGWGTDAVNCIGAPLDHKHTHGSTAHYQMIFT